MQLNNKWENNLLGKNLQALAKQHLNVHLNKLIKNFK
jgi:hypothetical protein